MGILLPRFMRILQMMVLYDILAAASLLMLLQKCFLASASSFGRRSSKARHLRFWKACMLASAVACILSLPHNCSAVSSPPPPFDNGVKKTYGIANLQVGSQLGSVLYPPLQNFGRGDRLMRQLDSSCFVQRVMISHLAMQIIKLMRLGICPKKR